LLAVLGWWRGGRRLRVLTFVAGGLVALFGAILLFNEARFGSALKTYALEQLLPESGPRVVLARALGLFFDAGFGLFAVAPLWVLLLPALLRHARRAPAAAAELGFLVLPYALLLAGRREWFGGWSPPFRYGLAVLPLLALPLAPLLQQRGRGGARLLLGALGAATGGLTLLWLAVPGWTYNFADGSTLLASQLGQQLGLDLGRLLPSAIRLHAASWWWPPLVVLAALLLWRWPRARRPELTAAGVGLALLLPAAALAAAAALPTGVVELEDSQVVSHGGALYPPRWTFDRPRFRGGWQLVDGASVEAPLVAGGARLRLVLWCREEPQQPAAATLLVAAGELPLAAVAVPAAAHWQRLALGPFAWPSGAPLVLSLQPGSAPVVVDRAEHDWE
jgi:hypothetical protein